MVNQGELAQLPYFKWFEVNRKVFIFAHCILLCLFDISEQVQKQVNTAILLIPKYNTELFVLTGTSYTQVSAKINHSIPNILADTLIYNSH